MNNTDIYTYRLMKTEEANCVYDIILQVFHEHVAPAYSEEGIKSFFSMLSKGMRIIPMEKKIFNI